MVVQFGLFALVAFGPRSWPGAAVWPMPYSWVASGIGAGLVVIGAVLATTGLVRLGRNLTVLPYPVDGAPLVVSGPYRIVRNPIYSGLIFASFGLGLYVNGWLTLIYAALLFALFDVKSRREERWLREKCPEYGAYQRRVRKLVPWVY